MSLKHRYLVMMQLIAQDDFGAFTDCEMLLYQDFENGLTRMRHAFRCHHHDMSTKVIGQ
jgi:hypothetical protein